MSTKHPTTNTQPNRGGPAQPGTMADLTHTIQQKGQTHETFEQYRAHRKTRPIAARPRSHMECTRSHADRVDARTTPTSAGVDGAGLCEEARDVRRSTSHARGNNKAAGIPETSAGSGREAAPIPERCARMADINSAPPLSSPSSYSQIASTASLLAKSSPVQLRMTHPLLCGLRGWRGRGCFAGQRP